MSRTADGRGRVSAWPARAVAGGLLALLCLAGCGDGVPKGQSEAHFSEDELRERYGEREAELGGGEAVMDAARGE